MAKGANPNPVTDADLATFDAAVVKWQRLLNLRDWRIERGTTRSKAMAEVSFDEEARLATYRVGEHFGANAVTPETLEATALHELLHVLLFDALQAAAVTPQQLGSREHAVVNVLEKLLMPAYRDAA